MEMFIATPFDQYGNYIVERWNYKTQQYERHLPKEEKTYYSKEKAELMAAQCNALADNNEDYE